MPDDTTYNTTYNTISPNPVESKRLRYRGKIITDWYELVLYIGAIAGIAGLVLWAMVRDLGGGGAIAFIAFMWFIASFA